MRRSGGRPWSRGRSWGRSGAARMAGPPHQRQALISVEILVLSK